MPQSNWLILLSERMAGVENSLILIEEFNQKNEEDT